MLHSLKAFPYTTGTVYLWRPQQLPWPTTAVFMMQAVVGCAAVGTALQVKAQAMLAETDAQAVALGYKADATKVDKTKQPKYAAGPKIEISELYAWTLLMLLGKKSKSFSTTPLVYISFKQNIFKLFFWYIFMFFIIFSLGVSPLFVNAFIKLSALIFAAFDFIWYIFRILYPMMTSKKCRAFCYKTDFREYCKEILNKESKSLRKKSNREKDNAPNFHR